MKRSDREFHSSKVRPVGGGIEPVLRLLGTLDEFRACVDIQRRIWGDDYEDVVPASLFQASQKVDAILGGALSGDAGELVGFVFGLSGRRRGRPIHWSHMVGVLPDHRGRGIGVRLKLAQRRWVLDQGIEEMRWSFDPLIAGNAHFNINLLGVEIEEYQLDMYGTTGSALHSFGTDRFIAFWKLSDQTTPRSFRIPHEDMADVPIINLLASGEPGIDEFDLAASLRCPLIRLAIPADIVSIHAADARLAFQWRVSTRTAFTRCFSDGFRIISFQRVKGAARCTYLLGRA